jgi:hypothetical protein
MVQVASARMSIGARLHRYRWFLAAAASLALGAILYVYVYPPVLQTVSFMLGRPHFENCSTAIKTEGELQAGKFRITEHLCAPAEHTMYVVFLMRAGDFAVPLLHSVEFPVPEAVRQHDAQRYEIVLAAPLTDGSDRLPVTLDATGFPSAITGSATAKSRTEAWQTALRRARRLRK